MLKMIRKLFLFTLPALGVLIGSWSTFALSWLPENERTFQSIRLPQAMEWLSQNRLTIQPVVVAVIDSGINLLHPNVPLFLKTNPLEINGNQLDDDFNGYRDDYFGFDFLKQSSILTDGNGHGTHVAGIIHQANPNAKVLVLKVLDTDGNGSSSAVIQAIEYAVKSGAKVINLSLGAADQLSQMKEGYEKIIRLARQNNILVLAAAGNDSSNNDQTPVFPANTWEDNIMAICSNNIDGRLSSFSNYALNRVHLCAPGENLLSYNAAYTPAKSANPIGNNLLIYMSGTSQATPLVSAVASILYGLAPNLKPYQVRDLLMGYSSRSISLIGASQSAGVLNAEASIKGLFSKPLPLLPRIDR